MFNEIFLVGKIASMPDFEKINNPSKDALMHLEVGKPYNEGMNEKPLDLIPVILWNGLADMILDTCHIGSLISVKGRFINCEGQPQYNGLYVSYVRCESVNLLDYILETK